jgi:AmmeMemoRadiSam system protein B
MEAHRLEHSLEVQVPFIQVLNPRAAIVPICLGHLRLEELLLMGKELGKVLTGFGEKVLLVASSDMTHYEPGEIARQKDRKALDRVLALDPGGLYRTVREGRISMCGYLPTVMMLAASLELGATTASLVRYGNSGDVTGDQAEVVGYAGVIVE